MIFLYVIKTYFSSPRPSLQLRQTWSREIPKKLRNLAIVRLLLKIFKSAGKVIVLILKLEKFRIIKD
jgi:hypothetical protein